MKIWCDNRWRRRYRRWGRRDRRGCRRRNGGRRIMRRKNSSGERKINMIMSYRRGRNGQINGIGVSRKRRIMFMM